MALGEVVNSASRAVTGGAWASSPLSFGFTATAGNLLVVMVGQNNDAVGLTPNPVSGYTLQEHYSDGSAGVVSGALYWKQADGTETAFTGSWTAETNAGSITVVEIDAAGLDLSAAAGSAEDESTASAAVTSVNTGSASIANAGGGLAVAGFMMDDGATVLTDYDSGFVEAIAGNDVQCQAFIARRVATASGSYSCTATLSAQDQCYACIVTFNKQAGIDLTSVDGDNEVYAGQPGIGCTGSGLDAVTVFEVRTGTRAQACGISDKTSTSLTLSTLPSAATMRASGIKWGACNFYVSDGASATDSLQGLIDPAASARDYHNVTDISQAGNAGCIYNGLTPAVAVGDQIEFRATTATYGWPVHIDEQGFAVIDSGGDNRTDSFDYYVFDASDETWGVAANWQITDTPALSAPAGSGTTPTEANVSVATSQREGTIWGVVTDSATTPTHAQIKAGQDHAGAAAAAAFSDAASDGTGAASITGLTAASTYYAHFTQENLATPVLSAAPVSSAAWTQEASATPPTVVTPIPNQTGKVGQSTSLNVAANFSGATEYAATPRPGGINFNTASGAFSGTFTTEETVDTTVTAINADGEVQDVFRWTISAADVPPSIATIGNKSNAEHHAGVVLTPTATGTAPITWSATGLPTGYTINSSTGQVAAPGDRNNEGTYNARITATNVAGTDHEDFTWTITSSDPVLAAIGNQTTYEATAGVVLTPSATGPGTLAWSALQLPPGYAIDAQTGVVTAAGDRNNQGTYPVEINVSNAYGTDIESITWTVLSSDPTVVAPIPDQSHRQGQAVSLNVIGNFDDAVSYVSSGHPTGVVFSGTGAYSGAPTTIGTYTVTVTASNAYGSVQDTFTWEVTSGAPVQTADAPDQVLYNGISYSGEASNFFAYATSYSSTAWPAGITMNSAGTISGTYTGGNASGTVTVTATNPYGSAQDTVSWTGYASLPSGGGGGAHGAGVSISVSIGI
jgi:hypothetical protein